MQMQRLNELYDAETNQVGFIGRLETDGAPVLEEAFVRARRLRTLKRPAHAGLFIHDNLNCLEYRGTSRSSTFQTRRLSRGCLRPLDAAGAVHRADADPFMLHFYGRTGRESATPATSQKPAQADAGSVCDTRRTGKPKAQAAQGAEGISR